MRCCKIKCNKKSKNAWKKMNTIKKIAKKRNKNEWLQKRGCSSIMGCAETNRKKEGQGRAFGPWTGSVQEETGQVRRGIKGLWDPFSFIFLFSFSLFLFLEREDLSSLLPSMKNTVVLFPETDGFRGGEEGFRRWLAGRYGGAPRRKPNFFYIFFRSNLFYSYFSFRF